MDTPKPYRPSNGTEGDDFYNKWCGQCSREDGARYGCTILAVAFAGNSPDEWIYLNDTPTCTAFRGEPLPEPRCPFTKEMFPDD